ncbi:hypothetical protein AAII07_25765 [Microvirga sp. 0TCS3.31]
MSAVEAKALTALSARLHASFRRIDRKAILGFALKFIELGGNKSRACRYLSKTQR